MPELIRRSVCQTRGQAAAREIPVPEGAYGIFLVVLRTALVGARAGGRLLKIRCSRKALFRGLLSRAAWASRCTRKAPAITPKWTAVLTRVSGTPRRSLPKSLWGGSSGNQVVRDVRAERYQGKPPTLALPGIMPALL